MAEGETPPFMKGVIIRDSDDKSEPQNIYSMNTLTPMQLATLRARIREKREQMRIRKTDKSFARAVLWTFKVYGYDAHLDSDFVPGLTYGATFDSFVEFIYQKERDAEAEDIVEDEEDDR